MSALARIGNWNDRRHPGDTPSERGLVWRTVDRIVSWLIVRGDT